MSLAWPWIVINMGGEMIYVLQQRLRAQAVPPARAARVLRDVAVALLGCGGGGSGGGGGNAAAAAAADGHEDGDGPPPQSAASTADADADDPAAGLFAPRDACSLDGCRALLERAAHASIMRLGPESMSKLFDLAAMAAKYQLLCSADHSDMLSATLRHLAGISAAVAAAAEQGGADGSGGGPGIGGGAGASTVARAVARAEAGARALYGGMSAGELSLLRHTLLRVLQGARVRVTLLMAEGIQGPDGRFPLPPCRCPDLGRVRAYAGLSAAAEGGQQQQKRTAAVTEWRHSLAVQRLDAPGAFFVHPAPLGENLYARPRANGGGNGGGDASGERAASLAALPSCDSKVGPERRQAGLICCDRGGSRHDCGGGGAVGKASHGSSQRCSVNGSGIGGGSIGGGAPCTLDVFAGLVLKRSSVTGAAEVQSGGACGAGGGVDDGFRLHLLFAGQDDGGGGGGGRGGGRAGSVEAAVLQPTPPPPPPPPSEEGSKCAHRRSVEFHAAGSSGERRRSLLILSSLDGIAQMAGGGADLLDLMDAAGE